MAEWIASGGHITQRDVLSMALQEVFLEGSDLMALGCCNTRYNWEAHACWNYVRCRQILRMREESLENEKLLAMKGGNRSAPAQG